jgi:hypothetical protein
MAMTERMTILVGRYFYTNVSVAVRLWQFLCGFTQNEHILDKSFRPSKRIWILFDSEKSK